MKDGLDNVLRAEKASLVRVADDTKEKPKNDTGSEHGKREGYAIDKTNSLKV